MLDTNAALALWWFEDPALAPLAAAIGERRILQPIASPPLIGEWKATLLQLARAEAAKVSGIPDLLETPSMAAILEQSETAGMTGILDKSEAPGITAITDRAVVRLSRAAAAFARWVLPVPHPDAAWIAAAALPSCRDPEDQKLLECAVANAAAWLLTRDKALLRLQRHVTLRGRITIATPEGWQKSDVSPHGCRSR